MILNLWWLGLAFHPDTALPGTWEGFAFPNLLSDVFSFDLNWERAKPGQPDGLTLFMTQSASSMALLMICWIRSGSSSSAWTLKLCKVHSVTLSSQLHPAKWDSLSSQRKYLMQTNCWTEEVKTDTAASLSLRSPVKYHFLFTISYTTSKKTRRTSIQANWNCLVC